MQELILTGASRGIGLALARALATRCRLTLIARDGVRLEQLRAEIEARGGSARVLSADLGSLRAARALGEKLAEQTAAAATLVHNAGIWPARRVLTEDGLEQAFAVNHLGPLALQQPLLARAKLARVLVVSAGLIAKGRFDPARTPTGGDFSGIATYCNTKLCFALAMRSVAAQHPQLDTLVVHPGVVRTDLGARAGVMGTLLALVKRRWEAPETCAERLVRILERPRWSQPGEAPFWFEERETPWPSAASQAAQEAVWNASSRLLARG
jgi:NAD(P)-dependent dehydrogenase (short-subunit alcohol dehydrogenase family)